MFAILVTPPYGRQQEYNTKTTSCGDQRLTNSQRRRGQATCDCAPSGIPPVCGFEFGLIPISRLNNLVQTEMILEFRGSIFQLIYHHHHHYDKHQTKHLFKWKQLSITNALERIQTIRSMYLLKWVGFSEEHNKWLSEKQLRYSKQRLEEYKELKGIDDLERAKRVKKTVLQVKKIIVVVLSFVRILSLFRGRGVPL